ncbi:hypothetical protein PIB30_081090 [Stylosanthes scabra]|uniref:Uncharacterized protein n=1 Tax=Stylosanthes scabra TaxID=79078 RepID=A0ABU6RRX6_9FABA|nr:hypothetical protein [Stylosanthes scabra]
MRSIAKNKKKLADHVGKLPPIQHSRLQKIKSQAHLYKVDWSGDDPFERWQITGAPINMAVDLGKKGCLVSMLVLPLCILARGRKTIVMNG